MAGPLDFDALAVRRRLGRDRWGVPRHQAEGMVAYLSSDGRRSLIVSSSDQEGATWLHASIAPIDHREPVPAYEELTGMHRAVWGEDGWAFQVFAPPAEHVNIRANALHLWGRLDGQRIHPNFGARGTI